MFYAFITYATTAYFYGIIINGIRIYHFLKRFRLRTLKEYCRLICFFVPKIAFSLLTFPFDLYASMVNPWYNTLDTLFMKDCLAVLVTQKSIGEVYRDYLRSTAHATCKTATVVYNESVEKN